MDLAQTQYRIRQLLATFQYKVEMASAVGALDINKYAETMLIPLFQEVYGYTNLKNLNAEAANYPGIDLGDEVAGVAFQITASADSDKVKHTLKEFAEHKHYEKYGHLIIYILTRKQQSYSGRGYDEIIQQQFLFNKDQDIIDYLDLIKVINTFPLNRARRILAILEENFGTGIEDVPIGSSVQQNVGASVLDRVALNKASSSDPITPENVNAFVQALTLFTAQTSTNQTIQTSPEDMAIQAKVEAARQLIQESNYDVAYRILLKLYELDQSQQLSHGLRFHIVNMLGCCALEAENILVAQGYFTEALQLDPKNVKALINSSTTAVFGQDVEKALELSTQARQLDPHNLLVLLAHLQALYAAGRTDEIRQLLRDEPELAQDIRSTPIIANIELEAGNYQTAADLVRKAVNTEPNNINHLLLLASILTTESGSDTSNTEKNAKWQREKLHSAEELLTRAVRLAEQQNKNRQLRIALTNRSAVRSLLGQLEDGLKDAQRVLDYAPEDPGALENKGRILLRMNQPQAAAQCFITLLGNASQNENKHLGYVRIGGTSQPEQIRNLLVDAYLKAGQPEKAKEILPLTPDYKVIDETQLGELESHLLTNEALGDELTITKIIEHLEQDWPSSSLAKLILAGHWARQKDLDKASRLLEQALELSQGRWRDEITVWLAQIRFQEGNYAEAARLFASQVDTSYDNPDLHAYILSLYNSRQWSEALQLAAQIRADIGPIAEISNIEVSILEAGGDLDGAREVLQQLIGAGVDVLTNQVHLANIEYRHLNLDTARQVVQSISYEAVRNNAHLLINLARLRLLLGLPGVLDFAYQARRLDYANQEVHIQYMNICFQLHGPEAVQSLQEPEVVGINTSVHLKRDEEITVFTILDERQVFADRGELSISDPLTQNLLGHRKGEQIVINSGFMQPHEYEIVDLQTKYLRASHESIFMFHSGKLRNPALEILHGTPEKLVEALIEFIDRRAQNASTIRDFYYKNRLPLSIVAGLIKRSPIEIWLFFVEASNERLISAAGSPADYQADNATLAGATEVVLDLTAVLTIVELGFKVEVASRFKRLLIAQGTVDELRDYQHELSVMPPSGFAFSSGQQRYFMEVPPEYIERRLTLVQKALEFIQSYTQVMPAMGTLELDQVLLENLGQSAAGSLTLAKDRHGVLYSDDLHLRRLAQAEWRIQGFATQLLLRDLRKRGTLSDDQYHAGIKLLAEYNYSFLHISSDDLMWALGRSKMKIDADVKAMFKPLSDPDCDSASVAKVLAEVIKRVWLSPGLDFQKLSVLDLALDTLGSGRGVMKVLPLLERALIEQFVLIPLHYQAVRAAIEMWLQLRIH